MEHQVHMEHRWGHRREINRFVRLKTGGGTMGFGCIRNVSISGAWIATRLPARLMSYVQIGFTAMQNGRGRMASLEGLIVRTASDGFGVEWRELAHPAVLAILMVRPHRSQVSTAKQHAPS
jgi:hypothetical protein